MADRLEKQALNPAGGKRVQLSVDDIPGAPPSKKQKSENSDHNNSQVLSILQSHSKMVPIQPDRTADAQGTPVSSNMPGPASDNGEEIGRSDNGRPTKQDLGHTDESVGNENIDHMHTTQPITAIVIARRSAIPSPTPSFAVRQFQKTLKASRMPPMPPTEGVNPISAPPWTRGEVRDDDDDDDKALQLALAASLEAAPETITRRDPLVNDSTQVKVYTKNTIKIDGLGIHRLTTFSPRFIECDHGAKFILAVGQTRADGDEYYRSMAARIQGRKVVPWSVFATASTTYTDDGAEKLDVKFWVSKLSTRLYTSSNTTDIFMSPTIDAIDFSSPYPFHKITPYKEIVEGARNIFTARPDIFRGSEGPMRAMYRYIDGLLSQAAIRFSAM